MVAADSVKNDSSLTNSKNEVFEDKAQNRHMEKFIKEELLQKPIKPKEVKLWFFVTKVTDIKIVDSSFSVILTISATWIEKDPKNNFNFDAEKESECKSWNKSNFSWNPQLRFLNLIDVEDFISDDWFRVVPVNSVCERGINRGSRSKSEWLEKYSDSTEEIKVTHFMKRKFVLSEDYELKKFPFDMQLLHVQISSSWDCSKVLLSFDDVHTCSCDPAALDHQEFEMHKPRLIDYNSGWTDEDLPLLSRSTESITGVRYSRAYAALTVERRPGFYLWNVGAMIVVLGILSFTAFSIPFENIGERLGVILTLVLSTLAFKLFIANETPNISYLTVLDKYILASIVYICIVGIALAIGHVIIHMQDMLEDSVLCNRIDLYMFVGFFLIWFMLNFCWFLGVIILGRRSHALIRKSDEKYEEYEEKIKGGQKEQMLDYKKCDGDDLDKVNDTKR